MVDDDPDMRQAIDEVLQDQAFPVDTAGDGRQALERAHDEAPALVILDITLPFELDDLPTMVARGLDNDQAPIEPN